MLESLENNLIEVKNASSELTLHSFERRKECLETLSKKLIENSEKIININTKELEKSSAKGIDSHVLDRMKITESTLQRMVDSLLTVSKLKDSVLEVIDSNIRENELKVEKVRVPLGVLGVIFESRPNVVIEIASLAIKSGNGLVMRGGSDCIETNLALFKLVSESLKESGLPEKSMYFLDFTDRKAVNVLLSMDNYIDLLIPRGSASLVNLVNENAKMPSITGGVGVCHTYVDSKIDTELALSVLDNAKTQNTSVCNAMDTVLIHKDSVDLIQPLFTLLLEKNVDIRADKESDGFELGLGAEVAVSTDKLHARGPMGINDLMTYKWVVSGKGQLRK